MNTKHTCFNDKTGPRASDIAAFCLACFPLATLLALVFFGDWIFPAAATLFR